MDICMTDSAATLDADHVPPILPPRVTTRAAPHVRGLLEYIIARGGIDGVTTDEIVAWDDANGRHNFDWNDTTAAQERRREQARYFLNRWRGMFDGMRVRGFIRIVKDIDAGIPKSAYFGVAQIAEHPGMRAQVIEDVTRRLKNLASELRMWHLSDEEQAAIFARLAEAMAPR
jgi:hypothetical protein